MLIQLIGRGGPVMWPLLLLSIISLAFILERLFFWVAEDSKKNGSLLAQILHLSEKCKFDEAYKTAKGSKDYRIKVLLCGLAHREWSITQAMEAQGSVEISRMRKNLRVLETVITIAPLLGILGTIIGIIDSFNLLGASMAVVNPVTVTRGIAQALITTASGLVIALFTVIPYNWFESKCEKARAEIEKYASGLEIVYKKYNPDQKKNEAEASLALKG